MEVRMTTVREILQAKGNKVWTIDPDKTVFDALTLMAAKEIGALVAVEDGSVCGMVSERDYARKVILKG
jgi:CBS domain-containing protein